MKQTACLILTVLICLCCAAALADQAAVHGYYAERRYVREEMDISSRLLYTLQPYEAAEITILNEKWGSIRLGVDSVGYIALKDLVTFDEETKEPSILWSDTSVDLLSMPGTMAHALTRVRPYEQLTLIGRTDGYLHLRASDGVGGYLSAAAELQQPVFVPEAIQPLDLVSENDISVTRYPLHGSEIITVIPANRVVTAEGSWREEAYFVRVDGAEGYVARNDVKLLAECTGMPVLTEEDGTRRCVREDQLTAINCAAMVTDAQAAFLCTDGSTDTLSAGEMLFLLYDTGAGYYGYRQGKEGCIAYGHTENMTMEQWKVRSDAASVVENVFLDVAFPLLEEGNAILNRYEAITEQEIKPLMTLGVPYFWGGRSMKAVTERSPLYSTREAWQSSPSYYRKGKCYPAGLDCVGFVRYVHKVAGHKIDDKPLAELGEDDFHRTGHHVICDENPLPEDWRETAAMMQPGDLILVKHPGFHAMMFIGTLRQYGYTAEQLPLLAAYLDYPMVIHCGGNPRFFPRFSVLIAASTDRVGKVLPPNGGVAIALIGIPKEAAEYTVEDCGDTYSCFDVEGTCITLFDFDEVGWHIIYR